MAKVKKKENLTPEECLQAALVPDWEWPYKVPENWCWIYLKAISKIQTGKKDANYGSKDGEYPFFTCAAEPIRCHEYSFECNAILLAGNGNINNINRYNGKFEAYQRTYVVEIKEPIYIDFIFYWFKYKWVDFNKDKMFGTAIPYIRLGNLQKFPIPLPPIAQQQSIVRRIESLFRRLDEAKQKIQDVLDIFEIRKASILQKAFSGEVTARWRREHGVRMESWEDISISEICHSLKYGTSKKSVSQGKVVVIRMGNLQNGEINWDDLVYSNDEEDIEKYRLFPGDVLFNRTNSPALVGKTSIYRGDYPAIYAGYLIKLDYDHSRIIGDFLNYSLNTISAKTYCNSVKTDGVNQSNINAKKIGAYEFKMPSIEEQIEIVRILDGMFAKEQQVKETVEAVLEQIDLIKKSILARAFRGELGTNDPREESSVELLKRSFSEIIDNEEVISKQVIKSKAKENSMPKTIMEALLKSVRLTPEQLKSETKLSIDDFYAKLKELTDNGSVVENRENGESYLEVANENRQTESQQL